MECIRQINEACATYDIYGNTYDNNAGITYMGSMQSCNAGIPVLVMLQMFPKMARANSECKYTKICWTQQMFISYKLLLILGNSLNGQKLNSIVIACIKSLQFWSTNLDFVFHCLLFMADSHYFTFHYFNFVVKKSYSTCNLFCRHLEDLCPQIFLKSKKKILFSFALVQCIFVRCPFGAAWISAQVCCCHDYNTFGNRSTCHTANSPPQSNCSTSGQLISSKDDSPHVTEQVDSISVINGGLGAAPQYFLISLRKAF